MAERQPLPGISKLTLAELRTIHEKDMQPITQSEITVRTKSLISTDILGTTDLAAPEVSAYIEKEQTAHQRRNEIWHPWHLQPDGRLSKKREKRADLLVKNIMKGFE